MLLQLSLCRPIGWLISTLIIATVSGRPGDKLLEDQSHTVGLSSGSRTLTLVTRPDPQVNHAGIELGIALADGGQEILYQSAPAQVALAIKNDGEQIVSGSYGGAKQLSAAQLEANASLVHGRVALLVSDRWSAVGFGALGRFELRRTITVQANPDSDTVIGLQSRLFFDLSAVRPSAAIQDLTGFAPALWYGNQSGIIAPGAIGADKTLSNYFARTDRFAAPLFGVLSPEDTLNRRGRATLYSLDTGLETVMADNGTDVLVDSRLGYGALGLRKQSQEAGGTVQIGYIFPGQEYQRTYTLGNKVLYRYHSARTGSVSRCSLAVTVDFVEPGDVKALGGELWSLIKSAWPLQQELYKPTPTNGSNATPKIAEAREAIAATVTRSIFRAPTSNKDGPQLGISGRRLENGRVFSGVFQMGFVCPQLKFAFGLLWDALGSSPPMAKEVRSATIVDEERLGWAMEIIEEWVRTSDHPMAGLADSERISTPTVGAGVKNSRGGEMVRMSHTSWVHGFGPPGCCPAGTAQGDGCPIVNNSLPACWNGTGEWSDDDGRFPGGDIEGEDIIWIRRHAEGHSLVLQAVALLESHGKTTNSKWLDWVVDGAESLLTLQRKDGSWGRAYRLEAAATDRPLDTNPLLDRADTLFPVYFLADAASYFAKTDPMRATRYLRAAVRGGECAWDLYGLPALFVAGDYVPSVDKEAGLFALRAFVALALADHPAMRAKWLRRASDTALWVDSLHYQVNIPLALDRPRSAPYSQYRDWSRDWYEGQSTVGLGFIELGHSGVDTTGSEFVPDLLQLYEMTQNDHFLNMALIQLHNTKQPLDVGGHKGYFERGFMPELWIFSIQAYNDPGGTGVMQDYNRGIGHHLNVPWPTACAALGIARACIQLGGARLAELTGQLFCDAPSGA